LQQPHTTVREPNVPPQDFTPEVLPAAMLPVYPGLGPIDGLVQ